MSATAPDAMETEKAAVKRAIAHEGRFRDEKQRIVESMGESLAELVTPSADTPRLNRKLKDNSGSTTASSLLSQGSARDFQQANSARGPEESTRDDLPRALDHSEEQLYIMEESRRPRFTKRTCYSTAAVVLLVVIGGVAGGAVALVNRGGVSSASTDGTGSDANKMCQLDRKALATLCKNGGLAVPDCAGDAYQELTGTYSDLLLLGGASEQGCTAAHQGLVALAVSQTNHGEDVTDPITFFAMSTLYFALEGTQWRADTNWLKGSSPCSNDDWFGVKCSEDGSPVELSLENNLLQGSLPSELGLLSNLRTLGIVLNQISGSLPSEIGLLAKLQTLDISWTSIHSSLPSEIGMLKELTQFISQGVPLTGVIPSEIGNMFKLEKLVLIRNHFTGTVPMEIGKLVQLRYLDLESLNGISGPVPLDLIALTRLEHLLISLAGVDPFPVPEVINLATNLKTINIKDSHVTGSLPGIAHLSHLEELHLRFLFMTGTLPTEIGLLSKLIVVAITGSRFQGTLPSEIGLLTKLTKLQIRRESKITGGIPSELGSLTALEHLDLSRTELDGTIPEEVCALNLPQGVFAYDHCCLESESSQANGCFWDTCGN